MALDLTGCTTQLIDTLTGCLCTEGFISRLWACESCVCQLFCCLWCNLCCGLSTNCLNLFFLIPLKASVKYIKQPQAWHKIFPSFFNCYPMRCNESQRLDQEFFLLQGLSKQFQHPNSIYTGCSCC